jgi:transposase
MKISGRYRSMESASKSLSLRSCVMTREKNGIAPYSSKTLTNYIRKDRIKKSFDDAKNYIYMKKMRTHSDATTEGKLFCAFLALIAVSLMAEKLRTINASRP